MHGVANNYISVDYIFSYAIFQVQELCTVLQQVKMGISLIDFCHTGHSLVG